MNIRHLNLKDTLSSRKLNWPSNKAERIREKRYLASKQDTLSSRALGLAALRPSAREQRYLAYKYLAFKIDN